VRSGTITDHDGAYDSINDWAESLVTYTFNAQLHLVASRNDDAYIDEYGADGIVSDGALQWERLAHAAIVADIQAQLGSDLDALLATDDDEDEDNDAQP
jgi:hypothetical protein